MSGPRAEAGGVVSRKKSVSGSRHAGPTSLRALPGATSGNKPTTGEPASGPSTVSGAQHRGIGRRGSALGVPDGSSTRRISPPSGHHRAPGVHNPGRTAPWNPLPVGDWRAEPVAPGARWMDKVGTTGKGQPGPRGHHGRTRPLGRTGTVALLAGLVAAALLGAVGVAVMAAASPEAQPDSTPGMAPISISAPSEPADAPLGAVPTEPSAVVSIPESRGAGAAEPTEQNGETRPTPVPTTPLTSSSPPAPAPVGPATVSELTSGDPGFGWPSAAFGTAPAPRTN